MQTAMSAAEQMQKHVPFSSAAKRRRGGWEEKEREGMGGGTGREGMGGEGMGWGREGMRMWSISNLVQG